LLLLVEAMAPLAPAQENGEVELARRIDALISEPEADKAFWGLEIYSPARGGTLYRLNAHRYFVPASVTKLFTAAAALDLIGPDHQFRTLVGTRGRIDRAGRLLGDLYFVGAGDPDLAGCALPYTPEKDDEEWTCDPTIVLDRLAQQVASKNVRTILGDLIIDQSFFAPEPYPPDWAVGDLLWSYGAPVRALSLADNSLAINVEPGEEVNDPALITVKPFTHLYRIENRVRTSLPEGETILYVRRDPGSRVITLSGSLALCHKGRTIKVAVEAPSQFAGELFRAALARQGIRVEGELRVDHAPTPPSAPEERAFLPVVLAEQRSRPLVEDVVLINKVSQNLHAEMLLRLLGQQEPPEAPLAEPRPRPFEPPPRRGDGSAEAGLDVLRAWLANAGVDPDEVELRDGSGLGRRNLVTPHAVVQLLRYVESKPWAPLFRDSLAIAGVDGTLEDRMNNSVAAGRVRAKTGSLAHTNALAAYVQTRAGERLLFALFLNHHTLSNDRALELFDRLCALLVDLPPAQATE
jgi:D-alanyl-D-alanine carboxypeptidase/D-alanyl-D-alanine-endopeptidase (penicillin-binding protein 4)